jgi:hypothetical protein
MRQRSRQIRFRTLRRTNLAKAIEAGARHAAEQAQMLDRGGALRLLGGHFFDDRVDGVARDDRSRASMSRKASQKNEIHLLLADLALELGDPRLGLRQFGQRSRRSRRSGRTGASAARLTTALPVQPGCPKLAISRPPLVKPACA